MIDPSPANRPSGQAYRAEPDKRPLLEGSQHPAYRFSFSSYQHWYPLLAADPGQDPGPSSSPSALLSHPIIVLFAIGIPGTNIVGRLRAHPPSLAKRQQPLQPAPARTSSHYFVPDICARPLKQSYPQRARARLSACFCREEGQGQCGRWQPEELDRAQAGWVQV